MIAQAALAVLLLAPAAQQPPPKHDDSGCCFQFDNSPVQVFFCTTADACRTGGPK